MNFKALFIDTNIFLHYRSFDEIDWLKILNVDQVEIRLPSIVVQELDKHKYSSSSKLRNKATNVTKKLHKLVDSGLKTNLKPNIDICFEVDNKSPDFAALNLDPNSQDDRLLASILSFRSENPSLPVILVAADLGLRLKAKYYQIEAICLPYDLKLPDELDQTDKRIRELEKEVLEFRQRTPDLRLCFSGNSDRITYTVRKPFSQSFNASETIERGIEQLQKEFPKMPEIQLDSQLVNPSHRTIHQMYGSDTPEILPHEISSYNKELDEFYKAYRQYLEEYIPWHDVRCRTFLLDISISNFGTCPAEDIDIHMHFPDGFSLCSILNLPDISERPAPPLQPIPRTRKDRLNLIKPSLDRLTLRQISPFISSQNRAQPNVSSLDIRRSNSYDVELHVRKLKQNTSEYFDSIGIIFESFEQVLSFQIDYRIVAANVPKPVTGKLHVILNDGTES
ncbi:MAG: hypothetical protein KME45_12135 [Stenomitos rutilans HA7619-LM2]|jgi:hypothetical protein|nr:hypothetical protein [Stenomitos rutilans HA7619-LM2]